MAFRIVGEVVDVDGIYTPNCQTHGGGCVELVVDGSITEVDGFGFKPERKTLTASIRIHLSRSQIDDAINKLNDAKKRI